MYDTFPVYITPLMEPKFHFAVLFFIKSDLFELTTFCQTVRCGYLVMKYMLISQ